MPAMSKVVYFVHVEALENGGFYVSAPALAGCVAKAKTFDAALKAAKIGIQKHIRTLAKAHKPIPTEPQRVRPLCVPVKVDLPKGAKVILASQLALKG